MFLPPPFEKDTENSMAARAKILWRAAYEGSLPELLAQLDAGADPDAFEDAGTPPLSIAAARGHKECLRALLEAGADPNTPCDNGDLPIAWALSAGEFERAAELFEAGARLGAVQREANNPIISCFRTGSGLSSGPWLAARGADPAVCGRSGETIAMLAAAGEPKALGWCAKMGVDLDAKDFFGCSAAHYAALNDAKESLRILESLGADIRSVDKEGQTPEALARSYGFDEFATLCQSLLAERERLLIGEALPSESSANKPARRV